MEEHILQQCQNLIGYRFSQPHFLSLALTHASVAPTRYQSNERLEFLGDAVLNLVICQELYQRHEDLLEGEMTKIKSSVVSRQTCAEIVDRLGLADLLHLSKGLTQPSGIPQSVCAAVFEAIIGAVYLDGGFTPARKFIMDQVAAHVTEALTSRHQRDYKSLLQQAAQRRWGQTPEYQLLDEQGPDHSKCFEVAVAMNGRQFPSAWGKTKKQAEQEAGRLTLIELGLLDDEDG